MANFLQVVILKIAQKFWISAIHFHLNLRFLYSVSNCLIQVKIIESSHGRSSIKLAVPKISQKLTEKHLCLNLFFNEVVDLKTRHSGTDIFLGNFEKFLKTLIFKNTLILFLCFLIKYNFRAALMISI